jgi:hypothetical protein
MSPHVFGIAEKTPSVFTIGVKPPALSDSNGSKVGLNERFPACESYFCSSEV